MTSSRSTASGKRKASAFKKQTPSREWQGDKKHGKGVCIYADGRKYDGEWQSGLRHGEGVLTYPNGSKYDGSWQHDKEHGCLADI